MTITEISIIGRQRRMRQLGEIRIGHTVDTGRISKKTSKPILRPEKLDKFRLTSASRPILEEVAKLYGGQVKPWQPPNGGPQEWEVYTQTDRLPVIIPPQRALSQSYELYKGSKCVRRCNGRIEEKTDRACMCDPDERDCTITTRLNVMLRDVPPVGLWLLTSHGESAADELPPIVGFLASTNGYVDAWLGMEFRRIPQDDGPPFEFMVPTLDIWEAPGQLRAGQGGISPEAVGAGQQSAVAAGQPAQEVARPAIAATAEPATPASEATPDDERDAAYIQRAIECHHADQVRAIYSEAVKAGHMHKLLADQLTTVGRSKSQTPEQAAPDSTKLTADDHIKAAFAATTLDELTAALDKAQADGHAPDLANAKDPVAAAFTARHKLLSTPEQPAPAAPAGPDRERLWAEIVTAASLEGFERIEDIEQAFARRWDGDVPAEASATQLQTFLGELKDGTVRSPQAAAAAPVVDSEVPF